MDQREIEEELSRLDRAIQHFAEYIVDGRVCIYERDLPVRSIIVSHNGVFKRIKSRPILTGLVLCKAVMPGSTAKSEEKFGWINDKPSPPSQRSTPIKNLLHRLWSRVEAISSTDLTPA